jgi:hypothetical protein
MEEMGLRELLPQTALRDGVPFDGIDDARVTTKGSLTLTVLSEHLRRLAVWAIAGIDRRV